MGMFSMLLELSSLASNSASTVPESSPSSEISCSETTTWLVPSLALDPPLEWLLLLTSSLDVMSAFPANGGLTSWATTGTILWITCSPTPTVTCKYCYGSLETSDRVSSFIDVLSSNSTSEAMEIFLPLGFHNRYLLLSSAYLTNTMHCALGSILFKAPSTHV